MARILICDDEPRIRELIEEYLLNDRYEVVQAGDGAAALALLSAGNIDLVILDVMMPFMDGMTCLKEMRLRHIDTPVIMLTAIGEEYDRVSGLQTGADDYVCKPFSPRELIARVKAVLSRTAPAAKAAVVPSYVFDGLLIDMAGRTIKIDGNEVLVTPKEFDLLVYMVQNKGIALSREKILQQVWNYDFYGEDRTVDTHVKMLRNHLGAYRNMLSTVWGVGYKFDVR